MSELNKQAKVQLITDYLTTSIDVAAGFTQYKEKADELLESIRVNGLWQDMDYCRFALNGLTPTYQNTLKNFDLF
jgi:hypothetical protein